MRKKIGKRIGPVPIALVAVFALAAFISAGFWLAPNSAQAQDGSQRVTLSAGIGTTIGGELGEGRMTIDAGDAVEIDVGEEVTVNLTGTFDDANESYSYTVYWDDATVAAGAKPANVETTFLATSTDPALTPVGGGASTFTLTPGLVQEDAGGESIARTATVRVEARAVSGTATADESFQFKVNVVENPIEINGMMVGDPTTDSGGNPVLWPDDGTCEVYFTNATNLLSRRSNPDDSASLRMAIDDQVAELGKLISGGACLSAEDTVEVSFTNAIEAGTDRTMVVYVTGGDDFADVEPAVGAQGLNEEIVEIEGPSLGDHGKETIEVTRSMANSSGIVYLIGYSGATGATGALTTSRLDDEDSTTFNRNAEFVVKAVFLDPPVEKDRDDNVRSKIEIDEVARNDEEIMADITIKDANGHPVLGFVNLTVEGDDSVVFADSSLKTHRVKLDAIGERSVEISGLPKTGPFKIKLTAEIGGLTLEKNIVRKGDATMVEATAYACEKDGDDDADADDLPIVCSSEIAALKTKPTSDDPNEVVALGPDDSFIIGAKATDAAGNTVSSLDQLTWKITSSADNVDDAEDTLTSNNGDSLEEITIAGSDNAVPGMYSLTVTSSDGDASTMIMITVSDVASMISVTCDPEMIPTASGLTECTVMVTDADGNIPSNLGKAENSAGEAIGDTIRVAVRSEGVDIIGVDATNDAKLDEEGMASFSVLLREDAAEGNITVFVSTSEIGDATLRTSTTVMYGDPAPPNVAPMAGDDVADQMVYVGAMVEVQSNFSDPDEDILSYMASSDMMDVATAMVDDMGMVTITGVAEGMATITVTASDPMGAYAMQTIMVTVMMMPPMELGAPSITSVMSDADGMATVMLMPGDNATKHYIWAQPTDLSQGMYSDEAAGDADMVTISGLTSGMNYWFIAIAGRGTGTDSEWSAWSGWTAETPVQ